ncbi:MAG: type pantothenate kinase [Rhodocyclales bacterium]|nr:type pantothenate kinase [Rhodocyclales bacterium]
MNLFIDAGNTRIKYAGHDGRAHAEWLFHDAMSSNVSAQLVLPPGFAPQRVIAVSVASADVNAHIERQLAQWPVTVEWFHASEICDGLRNAYEDPAQLGADRWAAAIGAWNRVKGACLVVGAGTATTIDIIAADGVFAGGCILPGLAMMQRSLASGTAALPLAAGTFTDVPRNTADAIFSGCLNAQLGAIARMRAGLPAFAPVLLAGGAGEALIDGIAGPVERVPRLVLEGLLHGYASSGQ